MPAAPGPVVLQPLQRVTSDLLQGPGNAVMTSEPETLRLFDSRRRGSPATDASNDDMEDELDGDDLDDNEPVSIASTSSGMTPSAPPRRHRSTFSKKDYRDMINHIKSNWTATAKDCRHSFWAPLVRTDDTQKRGPEVFARMYKRRKAWMLQQAGILPNSDGSGKTTSKHPVPRASVASSLHSIPPTPDVPPTMSALTTTQPTSVSAIVSGASANMVKGSLRVLRMYTEAEDAAMIQYCVDRPEGNPLQNKFWRDWEQPANTGERREIWSLVQHARSQSFQQQLRRALANHVASKSKSNPIQPEAVKSEPMAEHGSRSLNKSHHGLDERGLPLFREASSSSDDSSSFIRSGPSSPPSPVSRLSVDMIQAQVHALEFATVGFLAGMQYARPNSDRPSAELVGHLMECVGQIFQERGVGWFQGPGAGRQAYDAHKDDVKALVDRFAHPRPPPDIDVTLCQHDDMQIDPNLDCSREASLAPTAEPCA